MNATEPSIRTEQKSPPPGTAIATELPAATLSAKRPADAMSDVRPWTNIRMVAIAVTIAVILAALAAMATLPQIANERSLNAAAAQLATAKPRVTVAHAHRPTATADRVLPGNALALDNAAIFPRATGYVVQRSVDIGDHVKKGQLLAVISAPDIDDQLNQAKANLAQARANLDQAKANEVFAASDEKRYAKMLPLRAVSEEDYESKVDAYRVAQATVVAMEASIEVNRAAVQRFADLQGFERITAPFDGVVTARQFDVGDLLTADTPGTTKLMFEIQRTDILRVHANVPQVFATMIKVGEKAVVFRRESPGQQYTGTVTRTADALDPATRTLLTEVEVANPKDALRPGMFLQLNFLFPRPDAALLIPSAAILIRDNLRQVAVLDDGNRVAYRRVELGRDFGAEIEVLSGLRDGETVLVYPGDQLAVGTDVDPVPLTNTMN